MVIKGYRVGPLLRKTGREIIDDNVMGMAAGTAYNFFFSLFPLFLFAAPILTLVGDKEKILDWIVNKMATAVPPEAFAPIRGIVHDVVFAPNAPGLVSLGAVLALWSGSNVFGALMEALNTAYDTTETRPWWKQKLLQVGMVIAVGLLMTIAAVVMLGGPALVETVANALRLGPSAKWGWMVIQYPLAFLFLVAAMWMIYYLLPNYPQHKTQILVGAVAASLLWVLATQIFRLYVVNFNQFNKAYGTIGAVILLLSWMYYSMVVILAGGELNSELAHGTGRLEPRAGAVYDGRIVTAIRPDLPSNDRIEPAAP